MRIVPFSLLQTLMLKDDNGAPWVPSWRDSLLVVPIGAVFLSLVFEATKLLGADSSQEHQFEWGNIPVYIIYIFVCYYLLILPLFVLQRRTWEGRRNKENQK